MKILAYNSSARGSGQFVRSLKCAQIITDAFPRAHCLVLVGNSYIDRHVPERTAVVKMPMIRKTTHGDYVAIGPNPAASTPTERVSAALSLRKSIIRETIAEYAPDVLLVDSRPAGLNGELIDTLESLAMSTKCMTVLVLRDIVDAPDIVLKQWRQAGIHSVIARLYDKVIIFGERALFDSLKQYGLTAFRKKVLYLGYLGTPGFSVPADPESEVWGAPKRVLVTVGGGFDGDHIIRTVCEYIDKSSWARRQLRFKVVLGCNSSLNISHLRERYSSISGSTELYTHLTSLEGLITEANLVISMCGYNSLAEIIERRKRVIGIPRCHSGAEQFMRARLFDRVYDGMWILSENELSAVSLGRSVNAALSSPTPMVQLDMRGGRNLVAFLSSEVGREV